MQAGLATEVDNSAQKLDQLNSVLAVDASENSRVIVPAVPTAVAPIAPPETVEEFDSRCYNICHTVNHQVHDIVA